MKHGYLCRASCGVMCRVSCKTRLFHGIDRGRSSARLSSADGSFVTGLRDISTDSSILGPMRNAICRDACRDSSRIVRTSMTVSPCPSDLRGIGFLKGKVATGSFRSWGVASTPTPTSLQASSASVNAILFRGQPLPPTSQDHVDSSVPRQRARLWSTCLWEACHPAVLHPGDTHAPTCEMRFLLPQHNIQVGRAEK